MTPPNDELLVSATGLAMLLDISYETIKMIAAQERWHCGELPTVIEGPGRRRWRIKDIDAWLLANERTEWARADRNCYPRRPLRRWCRRRSKTARL